MAIGLTRDRYGCSIDDRQRNTDLNRYINMTSSNFGRLEEIMAPRIARLVARIRF